MTREDLLRALAALIALERYSVAEAHAQLIPDYLDLLDILRAQDGVTQLARAVDAHRRGGIAA